MSKALKRNVVTELVRLHQYKTSPFANKRQYGNLARVLSAAVSDEQFVAFTPIGKHMISMLTPEVNPEKVPNNGVPIKAEAIMIHEMIQIGLEFYGTPVFTYDLSGDETRYEDVDYWRNLIKAGREMGPKGGESRIEALEKLANPERGTYVFDPDCTDMAIRNIVRTYVGSIVSQEFRGTPEKYSITSSTTNAGEWTYLRKSKNFDGVPVRDIMKHDVKNLDHDWNLYTHLPAFLGARTQRGKWQIVSGISTEEWLTQNYKLSREEFCKKFVSEVRFTNIKNRVIAAAPGSCSLWYADLGYAKIEAEKRRLAPAQVHLSGPVGIEQWMRKARELTPSIEKIVGMKILFYNGDIWQMDSQMVTAHADEVYLKNQYLMPVEMDKKKFRTALLCAMVRPVIYLDKPVNSAFECEQKLKVLLTAWWLKSGEPVTNDFGSDDTELQTEKSRLRTAPTDWNRVRDFCVKNHFAPVIANGDDNQTIYFIGSDGTIKEDLTNHTNDMEQRNGLIFKDPTLKGEAGLFYNQFRLTPDGRFCSPMPRIREYHKESSRDARSAYLGCIDYYMNFEYRYDCKPGAAKAWVTRMRLPFDKTQVGTVDMETGKLLTFSEFKQMIKLEVKNDKKKRTLREMLFGGNPWDERILNEDGTLKEDWLKEQWTRMYVLIHDKQPL